MELVKHETCFEYFRRRLSEGWECISIEGYNAVLLSPGGIRRELDLRNDVETLRPNATGSECNIENQDGCSACPDHYDCVDEAEADDSTTVVRLTIVEGTKDQRDLYNIPNSGVGAGTINKITVYLRCSCSYVGAGKKLYASIRTHDTVYGTAQDPISNLGQFEDYSEIWTENPHESAAWTWDEINALEIGVRLLAFYSGKAGGMQCTQVYVEVDYSEVVGLENKSANMGSKMVAAGLI